jgi:Flp pilus assembly protein TadD
MSRFPEALQALRKALRLAPPDAQPWVCLHIGKVHDDRSSHRLAQRWYARAASLSPKEATWYICLGGMMAAGPPARTRSPIGKRRARKGCIDEAFHNLGLVLRAQERYAEAKKCFARLEARSQVDAKEAFADVVHALQLLRAPRRNGSRKARKGRGN